MVIGRRCHDNALLLRLAEEGKGLRQARPGRKEALTAKRKDQREGCCCGEHGEVIGLPHKAKIEEVFPQGVRLRSENLGNTASCSYVRMMVHISPAMPRRRRAKRA